MYSKPDISRLGIAELHRARVGAYLHTDALWRYLCAEREAFVQKLQREISEASEVEIKERNF